MRVLPTRTVDQLREIDPQYRLPEEQARIAEADAAYQALLERRRSDRRWVAPVLSAVICVALERKQAAAGEIKTEYGYAKRYGGMIDKVKIYDLQQTIREEDEAIAETRGLLRQFKASP